MMNKESPLLKLPLHVDVIAMANYLITNYGITVAVSFFANMSPTALERLRNKKYVSTSSAFSWLRSPEGTTFWADIHRAYYRYRMGREFPYP